MRRFDGVALGSVLFVIWTGSSVARDHVLTLEQTLNLARERAPAVLAARASIEEARGRLVGASAHLGGNPTLESWLGRRTTSEGTEREMEIELTQPFLLGGVRAARIAGAEAGVSLAEARSDTTTSALLRDVAAVFLRALYADERVRSAGTAERLSAEILQIAERRFETGDIPKLDVNVLRAALSRSRSELEAARALRDAAVGELRVLLGLDANDSLELRGELATRERDHDLEKLLAVALERPDLRALEAAKAEADAEVALARGLARPEVDAGLRYAREEGDDVGLAGVSLTFPVFHRGQGLRAEAGARSRRLGLELEAGRAIVVAEVRAADDAHRRRLAAVEELEQGALPLLDEIEAMAKRSYEAGQTPLADLLSLQRELLETRADYLERAFEAGLARIELEAVAGVLR